MLETKFCPNCHRPYDASLPECPACKREAVAAARKARQEDLNDALHGEKREALHQLLTNKLRTGQDDDEDATVIADDPPEAEAPDQGDGAAPAVAEQVTDNQALLDEMLPGDPEEDAPSEEPEGDAAPPTASPDNPPRKGGKSPVGKVILAVLIVALAAVLCFGGYALLSSNGGTGTAGSSGVASSESGAQDSQEGSASEAQGEDAQADGTQEDESQAESEAAEDGVDTADGSTGDSSADGDGETGTDQTGDDDADSETDPDVSAEGSAETETPDADEGGETAGDSGAEAENDNTDGNTSEENSNTDSLSSDNAQPETADTGADTDDTAPAAA